MKKKFTVPALVLGSDKSGLGIIRSLGKAGIPVINVSYDEYDIGYTSRYSRGKYFSPHPQEDDKSFIKYLKDLSSNFPKAVVIPADQYSMSAVSRYRNELSGTYTIPVNDWEINSKLLEINYILDTAQTTGIHAPRFFIPCNLDMALWFLEEAGYPVFLKSTRGSSLKDIFKTDSVFIENENHLKNFFTIADKFDRRVMLQEFIPGNDEVYYDSYTVNSKQILEFSFRRLRSSLSTETSGRILKSEYVPEVFESARKILKKFNYSGYSSIHFRKDQRSGAYKLLDISPQLSQAIPLAARCGINFPYSIYIHSLLGIIPQHCSVFKEGIYWIDPAFDLKESFKNYGEENLSIKKLLSPYMRSKVYSISSLSDPLPLVKSFGNSIAYNISYYVKQLIRRNGKSFLSQ
jgi:D-aspartate ligase